MKLRRIFVCLLIFCIMTVSLSTAAFADIVDDLKKEPNAMALITIDNQDCVQIPNLEDLSVRVTAPDTNIDIVIPVEKVEEEGEFLGLWLGYPKDRIGDAIMKELAEIQGKVDLGLYETNPEKFLTEIDHILSKFRIEIVGLPNEHYSVVSSSMILTSDIFKQVVDLFKQMMQEEIGDFDSFASLIDKLLAEEGMTLDQFLAGLENEEAAAIRDLIENLDPLLEYITSAEYSGLLIAGAQLACECPVLWTYQIVHLYYERIDGKLKQVGCVYEGAYDEIWEEYYLTGKQGEVIRAQDHLSPNYQGLTYSFMGSYDSIAFDDGGLFSWADCKMDSFVLGEDATDGLALRYVVDLGKSVTTAGNVEEEPIQTPDTGDQAPLGLYIGILIIAIAATGAIAAYHKKK